MPVETHIKKLTRQPGQNHRAMALHNLNPFYQFVEENEIIGVLLDPEVYPLIKKAVYAEFRAQSKTDDRLQQYTAKYVLDWVVQDIVTHIHNNQGLAFPKDWRPQYHWEGRMLKACKNKTKDVLNKIRLMHNAEQLWVSHILQSQDFDPEKNAIHAEIDALRSCIDPLHVAKKLLVNHEQSYALLLILMLKAEELELSHFTNAKINPKTGNNIYTRSPLEAWDLWIQNKQEYLDLQQNEGTDQQHSRNHIAWILFGTTGQSKQDFLRTNTNLSTIRDSKIVKPHNRAKKKIAQYILSYSLIEIELLSFDFICAHTAQIVESSYLIHHDQNKQIIKAILQAKQEEDVETIARLLFSKGKTVLERLRDRKSYMTRLNLRIQEMRDLFPHVDVKKAA